MDEELSELSIRRHEIKKPTWFELLKENNSTIGHKRNLSSNLVTPHKTDILTPASIVKDSSPSLTFDMSLQLESTFE